MIGGKSNATAEKEDLICYSYDTLNLRYLPQNWEAKNKMETLGIITRVEENEILILRITGFIDASNINQFERHMHEQIEKGYSKIILDCSEIQYINSSALGIILDIHQLAIKRQGGIKIIDLPRKFEKTFEMLGFTDYFQVFSEEEKALQSFL